VKNKKNDIKITHNLRPCLVGKEQKKALFHAWSQNSKVIEPSIMKGGHGGGVVAGAVALVEMEDGQIKEVMPWEIRFLDSQHNTYIFEGAGNE